MEARGHIYKLGLDSKLDVCVCIKAEIWTCSLRGRIFIIHSSVVFQALVNCVHVNELIAHFHKWILTHHS